MGILPMHRGGRRHNREDEFALRLPFEKSIDRSDKIPNPAGGCGAT
jgi:hypothetical protein